jgi:hypothetical protein
MDAGGVQPEEKIKKADVLSFLKKEHKKIIAYAMHGDKIKCISRESGGIQDE